MKAKTTKYAKLFQNGSSQAVRLPKEFRFPGERVRIRRVGKGVLLEPEPEVFDIDRWFASMHSVGGDFEFERDQPLVPDTVISFD